MVFQGPKVPSINGMDGIPLIEGIPGTHGNVLTADPKVLSANPTVRTDSLAEAQYKFDRASAELFNANHWIYHLLKVVMRKQLYKYLMIFLVPISKVISNVFLFP